jgi:hypothetical protein
MDEIGSMLSGCGSSLILPSGIVMSHRAPRQDWYQECVEVAAFLYGLHPGDIATNPNMRTLNPGYYSQRYYVAKLPLEGLVKAMFWILVNDQPNFALTATSITVEVASRTLAPPTWQEVILQTWHWEMLAREAVTEKLAGKPPRDDKQAAFLYQKELARLIDKWQGEKLNQLSAVIHPK